MNCTNNKYITIKISKKKLKLKKLICMIQLLTNCQWLLDNISIIQMTATIRSGWLNVFSLKDFNIEPQFEFNPILQLSLIQSFAYLSLMLLKGVLTNKYQFEICQKITSFYRATLLPPCIFLQISIFCIREEYNESKI